MNAVENNSLYRYMLETKENRKAGKKGGREGKRKGRRDREKEDNIILNYMYTLEL